MINKVFYVIIGMYFFSGMTYVIDHTLAAPIGMSITGIDGQPLTAVAGTVLDVEGINQVTRNIEARSQNQTVSGLAVFDVLVEYNSFMMQSIAQLIPLLTGTAGLFLLVSVGVPEILVWTMGIGYSVLVLRAIVGLVRGS